MPKGSAYVKLFYGQVTAAEQYAFDGHAKDYIDGLPGDTYRDRSLYLYSEIGLSNRFSMVLSLPYKRTFVRDHAFRFRIFGLGTASLGGRLALLPLLGIDASRSALAANFMVHVPTGYTRNFAPSTGAGQVDFQAALFFGHSFHTLPVYAQIGAGYRHRSSMFLFSQAASCSNGSDVHCIPDTKPSYGDEMLFHAEAGLTLGDGVMLLQAVGTGNWSISAPRIGFSALNPIPTHHRYLKVGTGITWYPFRLLKSPTLDTFGISTQYFITPFGQNTINSKDLFVGFEIRPTFF